MSGRNLYRQKLRAALTVLGVSVGVIAIVALGSISRGVWASTDAAIHNAGVDLSVFQKGVAADLLSSLDEKETRAAIEADPDVEECFAVLTHILPVEKMPFFLIFGVSQGELRAGNSDPLRGRRIESDNEIALGILAERSLNKTVDDEVTLLGQTFRIAAVFHSDIIFFDGSIVMRLPVLQQLVRREGQVTNFQVRLRPGADASAVVTRLEEVNPEIVAIASVEEYSKVDKGLEIVDSMVTAVSIIALVIGSLVVTNTMWMSVHERTREIGVLRAMGWSRRGIVTMIMLEAGCVGLAACVLGSGLGVALAKLSTKLPVINVLIDPVFALEPFLLALTVAISLSIIGAALPAWRAARISPVEALRYE